MPMPSGFIQTLQTGMPGSLRGLRSAASRLPGPRVRGLLQHEAPAPVTWQSAIERRMACAGIAASTGRTPLRRTAGRLDQALLMARCIDAAEQQKLPHELLTREGCGSADKWNTTGFPPHSHLPHRDSQTIIHTRNRGEALTGAWCLVCRPYSSLSTNQRVNAMVPA